MKDSRALDIPLDLTGFLPFQMAVVSARLFQKIMSDAEYQLPEWRIMMALPRHQPCSSNDLCALTSMDAARVCRAQRRLEALGMIDVSQDRQDRRRLVVMLTDKGTTESERLNGIARLAEERLLAEMTEDTRSGLRSALQDLFQRA